MIIYDEKMSSSNMLSSFLLEHFALPLHSKESITFMFALRTDVYGGSVMFLALSQAPRDTAVDRRGKKSLVLLSLCPSSWYLLSLRKSFLITDLNFNAIHFFVFLFYLFPLVCHFFEMRDLFCFVHCSTPKAWNDTRTNYLFRKQLLKE